MTEKTRDEKMRELDEQIERHQKSINDTLVRLVRSAFRNALYTTNGTAP